ncbi:MAG TPA: hypothetical protein VI953_00595 [Candidatus Paceibacterota bacterium]
MENERINPWRVGVLSTLMYIGFRVLVLLLADPVTVDRPVAPMNAARVVEFQANIISHGGTITIIDGKGKKDTFVITADQEKMTTILQYPRDRFYRHDANLDFTLWYWDGDKPEQGRMVLHKIS